MKTLLARQIMGSAIITLKHMKNSLNPDTCKSTELHNKKGIHFLDYEQDSCRKMEGRKQGARHGLTLGGTMFLHSKKVSLSPTCVEGQNA